VTWTLPRTTLTKKILLLATLFFLLPDFSFGQFEQLLSETEEFKNNSRTLSQDIVDIIKIVAGVAIAIMGLTYLYLRDQQTDLTEKLGKAILGIAIFLALIAVGEGIASI
jgi:hypothetical protein